MREERENEYKWRECERKNGFIVVHTLMRGIEIVEGLTGRIEGGDRDEKVRRVKFKVLSSK